jgi:PucR family transcriptional regulator, purine catabolism regulatory protein
VRKRGVKVNGLSIQEAMDLGYIRGCRAIAGAGGLGKRIINVNIMVDFDILNWAKPGELLLTTAYVFKHAELSALKKLLTALNDKGLSGLCIKIKPYVEALDPELIKLAEEMDFPLLELDYEIPFNDIMTPIFKHLFDQQAMTLKQVESVHNEMMRILIQGQGAQQVIDLLSEAIGNPVCLKDVQFEEVLVAKPLAAEGAADLMAYVEAVYKRWEHQHHTSKSISETAEIAGKTMSCRIFPIRVKELLHGHLIVVEQEKALSAFDIQALESALPLLSMDFLKKLSVQEVEGKYKAEFFEDLISMDETRKSKAIERCGYYRFNKDLHYNIMTIHFSSADFSLESLQETNQKMLKLAYLLELQMTESYMTYMLSQQDKRLSLLLMWETEKKYDLKIQSVVDRIRSVLEQRTKETFSIGVGRLYKHIENAQLSLKDAEKAIQLKGVLAEEESVFFDDLGIYKILCQDHLKDELNSFYKTTLKKLVDYDKKRDTHLIETLENYFIFNGNLRKMSEELFTHYNTILYRMNRIEEIAEKKLDNEKDRFALQAALKIRKLLQING